MKTPPDIGGNDRLTSGCDGASHGILPWMNYSLCVIVIRRAGDVNEIVTFILSLPNYDDILHNGGIERGKEEGGGTHPLFFLPQPCPCGFAVIILIIFRGIKKKVDIKKVLGFNLFFRML